jgi:hypothetical protein
MPSPESTASNPGARFSKTLPDLELTLGPEHGVGI